MKLLSLALTAAALASAAAVVPPQHEAQLPLTAGAEQFLIELSPGETRWVTEDEKWALRRAGHNFMDITLTPSLGALSTLSNFPSTKVHFPNSTHHSKQIRPLLPHLSQSRMRANLERFTAFHTRYYKSASGTDSAAWLRSRIQTLLKHSNATHATVEEFQHSWNQPSLIARIPGRSNNTIVIGAHQDSINLFLPSLLAAPGADDDGSGTVTILEALRVLLTDPGFAAGNATNTVEFHWYSAEEGGLLGSQAVFADYESRGVQVKAMLQQDMTGYVQGTLDAGRPEAVGVITDFVDPGLTEFVKLIITEYCDIPYVLTKCGYACSDHASASKAGYASAFVIESAFGDSDKRIHTGEDRVEYLDFGHMRQHAVLTLGVAFELGWADL